MSNSMAQSTGRQVKNSVKFWGVVACLTGSFLFLAFQGGKLAYMLFIVVTILSLYFVMGRFSGIASAKGMRLIRGEAKAGEFTAGSSVPVHIQVQLPRLWLFPYIIVKDRLLSAHGDVYDFELTFVPDWRSRGQVQYLTPPLRRGVYTFENTRCTTEDVFGMFQHHGTLELNNSFSVLPQMVMIKEWAHFQYLTRGTHHHSTTTRAVRETTQINGVRDYVYGDRISRIHWNATARTGEWKSKEFEKETLPKTTIILDCQQSAYADSHSFELAVSIAASLFKYGLFKELTLGVLCTGAKPAYIEASRGEYHYQRVMRQLVQVEADGQGPLDAVLQQYEDYINGGSFFIFISPQHGEVFNKAMRIISSKQLSACHIWVSSGISLAEKTAYHERSKRLDYKTYAVSSLAELPVMLGGKG